MYNAKNVPTNTLIRILFDEALNPLSINPAGVYLLDRTTNTKVNTITALDASGQGLTLTPTAPLLVNRNYDIAANSVQDLAKNEHSTYSTFTTGTENDTQAPLIQSASIDEGQLNIPLNTRLRARFNEPVNIQKLTGATLTLNSVAVPVNLNLSEDRLLLTITPKQLLTPNTTYQFTVNGIEDLSGNRLAESLARHFTTSAKVDGVNGTIIGITPASSANNVPLNTEIKITLSEVIEPAIFVDAAFYLQDGDTKVEGRIVIGTDKKLLAFIPASPLKPARSYAIYANYGYTLFDLAGNPFIRSITSFTTANQ
jgi:large repetitive protein